MHNSTNLGSRLANEQQLFLENEPGMQVKDRDKQKLLFLGTDRNHYRKDASELSQQPNFSDVEQPNNRKKGTLSRTPDTKDAAKKDSMKLESPVLMHRQSLYNQLQNKQSRSQSIHKKFMLDKIFTLQKFNVFKRVRQISQKLIERINYHKIKSLGAFHYSIISDISCNQISSARDKLIIRRSHFTKKLVQLIDFRVFLPSNPFIQIWNLLIIFNTFLLFMQLPVVIAFSAYAQTALYNKISLVQYLLDVLIRVNTAHYKDEEIVVERQKIVLQYVKTRLPLHCLVIAALIADQKDFYFIYAVKIAEAHIDLEEIIEMTYFRQKFSQLWQIMSLIIFVFVLAHFSACAFYFISNTFYEESSQTWLDLARIDQSNQLEVYLNALYFTFITMITVGYGDITPVNNGEKIFVIVLVFLSSFIVGYTVSTVGRIFAEQEQKHREFK